MADLTKKHEFQFEQIGLIPSDGGKFEIRIDTELLYSKLATGRHPEPGEIEDLVTGYLS